MTEVKQGGIEMNKDDNRKNAPLEPVTKVRQGLSQAGEGRGITITPYNFFTASSADLQKAREANGPPSPLASHTPRFVASANGTISDVWLRSGSSLSATPRFVASANGTIADAWLRGGTIKPSNALPFAKLRIPSATITSATSTSTTNQVPELPRKTEQNPTLGISRVTTVTTKTATSTTTGLGHDPNNTNAFHITSPTITTVKTERTVKYSDFGTHDLQLDSGFQFATTAIPPIETASSSGKTAGNGSATATANDSEMSATANKLFDPFSIQPGTSGAVPLLPQITPTPPSLADIGNWVPFPPELAKTKKRKKSFTPFQLEQLNHQLRMYHLANQVTINAKKAGTIEPPQTRSKTKNAAARKATEPADSDPTAVNPPTPKRRGRPAQTQPIPIPVPNVQPNTVNTSRKRKADMNQTPIQITPPIGSPKQKQAKPKRQTKKSMTNVFDLADSPIPLVFVDCSFCAVSKPTTETIGIESCLHVFCLECLENYVKHSSDPQISCPLRDEGKCNGVLSDPEIKKLVDEDAFQKYLQRSLTSALAADSDLTPCFVPGCSGLCVIEGQLRLFYCPVCSKLNCLDCKTTHEGTCPNKKKRRVGVEMEGGVIDLANSTSEEDKSDGEEIIAMKLPAAETEEEMKVRLEWEASWAQLVSKFNGDKESGNCEDKKPDMNVFADIIKTDHVFECPICIVDVDEGQGVILQECFHRFCRDCLVGSIEHSEEIRVKCPYQSGSYSCQMHITDKEVRALATEDIYDKLLKKSLAAAEMGMSNAFHCQSVNCTGWAEIEDNQVRTFRCYICSKKNCVPCKAIHDALTCAEYQSRLKEGEFELASREELNRMISKGEAMKCPTCKVVIIKNGGCDGMTCVVCQTHICWATKGPRWGPKGRGDDSAGCRCGYNGKKCHPKCSNCH